MKKKAIHFGAGNIGRGFLGQLYFESGYATTFVDVVPEVLEALNARHAYPLRIVAEDSHTIEIADVRGLHAGDTDQVVEAIAEADIGSTAVGVRVLPKIAPALAAGLERRFGDGNAEPLDFVICENMLEAGPFMRERVREHLAPEYHEQLDAKVGFVEASIGRMVPVMTAEQKAEDPLLVCVEPYCELPVDANGFRGPIPCIVHLAPKQNFGAYVERKLFVHNMSHAATAYLGRLRGHDLIWQAVEDPRVRPEVEKALAETCAGLVAKHGLDAGELREHAGDLLRRYGNKALGDQIARIGGDPVRKLGHRDRLIGAGLMCLDQGIEPKGVAFATAAALHYENADDASAQRLQEVRRNGGVDGVLRKICEIEPDSPLASLIHDGLERLEREGWLS